MSKERKVENLNEETRRSFGKKQMKESRNLEVK